VLLVALASIDRIEDVGETLFVGAGHTATESARALAETSPRSSDAATTSTRVSQESAQFLCDAGDPKKLVASARHEVDQEVDVALGRRITRASDPKTRGLAAW